MTVLETWQHDMTNTAGERAPGTYLKDVENVVLKIGIRTSPTYVCVPNRRLCGAAAWMLMSIYEAFAHRRWLELGPTHDSSPS